MDNIKIKRFYKQNLQPNKYYVNSGRYTFEKCNTLEEAKKALKKYKNGNFKNLDFYILEML